MGIAVARIGPLRAVVGVASMAAGLGGCSGGDRPEPLPVVPPRVLAALGSVSADSLLPHAAYLGDDARGGRSPGTPGDLATVRYLADRLAGLGVEPAAPDGTFLQAVPMHGMRPQPGTRLTIRPAEATEARAAGELTFEEDFLVCSAPADGVPASLPVVFVGYGIVAPEFDHDDYAGLDVSGTLVAFLSGEPPSTEAGYFAGDEPTTHSSPAVKQRVAVAHGALGSILLPRWSDFPYRDWTHWNTLAEFECVTAPWDAPRGLSLALAPHRAELLFEGAPSSFEEVQRRDAEGTLRCFPLAARAEFHGRAARRDFTSHNVIGRLPGADPGLREENVLVVAHHDHLGVGPEVRGDSIYNGVVDNALGCAGTLEIARVLASLDPPPARSILFLFTAGEEKGLLGSRYYRSHPAVPLHRTVAALNVDGLAIFDTFRSVSGIGADLSGLGDHLAAVAAALGLTVEPTPSFFRSDDALVSSDHLVLAQAGIPALLVMEGQTYDHLPEVEGKQTAVAWGQLRYHTPFDDLQQPIDESALEQHVRILLALTGTLGDAPAAPRWRPGAHAETRRRSLAEGH